MSAEDIRKILQNAEPVTDGWQPPRMQGVTPAPQLAPQMRNAVPQASRSENQVAEFEERTAVIEDDENLPREMAERLAAGRAKPG